MINSEIIQNGADLPHEAELGAWRPIDPLEQVHPHHIATTPDGTAIIPARIYGPRVKEIVVFEANPGIAVR